MKGPCHVSSLMRFGSGFLSEVAGGPIIRDHGANNRLWQLLSSALIKEEV